MTAVRALLVDAFTGEPLTGAPAGVVPDAEALDAAGMRAVAAELGASETAFVLSSDSADRRFRWFTPAAEADRPGHATLAATVALGAEGEWAAGGHTVETNAGVLDVELGEDGAAWMTLGAPSVREVGLGDERVADALGVDPLGLRPEALPFAVATARRPFLLVPLDYLETLGNADPDAGAMAGLCEEVGAEGVHAVTFDTLSTAATLHGRTWSPTGDEKPATGDAGGAAGAYLRHVGAFESMPEELRVEGGHYLDRPGEVRVTVGETVRVGGAATVALSGELSVPERGPDDIIEA
ncbi:MAG: PhzF family phenazine biosynthesis protein [Halobacteriales archaeon]